jgi:hypothetical protein
LTIVWQSRWLVEAGAFCADAVVANVATTVDSTSGAASVLHPSSIDRAPFRPGLTATSLSVPPGKAISDIAFGATCNARASRQRLPA